LEAGLSIKAMDVSRFAAPVALYRAVCRWWRPDEHCCWNWKRWLLE